LSVFLRNRDGAAGMPAQWPGAAADSHDVESVLAIVGLAAATLLVVAIGVAWWEQTRLRARARRTPPAPLPHKVTVDVNLAQAPGEPAPPAGDQPARHALLDRAMARMARAAPAAQAWMDTQPGVAPGQPAWPGQPASPEPSTRH
jgi:hypothetical protein